MSIRCKHCDSRLPEWDSIEGACRSCHEEYSGEFDLVSVFWTIAEANRNLNFGWSVFSECYDDQEIKDIYGDCKGSGELFERMATSASIWEDKHQDAEQYRKEAGR